MQERDFLTKLSIHKTNDMFYQVRDIAYFEEKSFFIVKPNHYKNWHLAIAQLDLMEIIDILLNSGGEK